MNQAGQHSALECTATKPAPAAIRKRAGRVPVANSLLAALPNSEYQSLLSELEPVTLAFGEVLYVPGTPMQHVYFPIDCLISLRTPVEGHRALEVGLVGHEGMVGVSLTFGIDVAPVRALVQGSGRALRMAAAPFRQQLALSVELRRILSRYTHAFMTQFMHTAACNHFHPAQARLARWLLMTRDRVRSNEFHLTHELLAEMLGIRRVGVTNAAGTLQRSKLISYKRGNIKILDRKGLEAAACKCYRILKDTRV